MLYDCLWANTTHTGTFDITPIDNYYRDLGVFVDQARYAPHSGETCGTSLNEANDVCWVLDNCSNMDQSMFDLSLDLLFYRYSTTIYDKWKSQGGWEEISRKLGYRIALQSITMPASGAPGSAGTLEVTWKNSGSGKVFNPRPIDLVYVGPGGPFTERVTSDARPSMPMPRESDRSESWAITLPIGLQSGQSYSVYLRLPDPDPLGNGLDADDRYSMRLANTGVWDGATGRHDLGATVTVP
jgi:hypothetical protein